MCYSAPMRWVLNELRCKNLFYIVSRRHHINPMKHTSSSALVFLHLITSWSRHPVETFFALLALCAGNSPVTGEFPSQRPVTRSFDVSFDLRLNLRRQRAHYDVIVIDHSTFVNIAKERKDNKPKVAETKWTKLSRRHFQMHFREWKCLNSD